MFIRAKIINVAAVGFVKSSVDASLCEKSVDGLFIGQKSVDY